MDNKETAKNSPVTSTLQPARSANETSFQPGARRGPGRPKGSQNKTTQTFRDLLLQAATEVGDSQEVGKDGQGGILAYLKVTAVQERKMFTLLMGRILPLKITTEVKQDKEIMTIDEAVADLKACGMEPLLALYLKRYPIERDDGDPEWAKTIDMSLADRPIEELMSPKGSDTGNDTEKE